MAMELRNRGIYTERDYLCRSLKAQMKSADRFNAQYVVIIGDEEIEKQEAVVREMSTGEQENVAFCDLTSYLERRI